MYIYFSEDVCDVCGSPDTIDGSITMFRSEHLARTSNLTHRKRDVHFCEKHWDEFMQWFSGYCTYFNEHGGEGIIVE